jgi:hypothetical protein
MRPAPRVDPFRRRAWARTWGGDQRGQTLPLLALMSTVIIGLVALAIDFGFLADIHRNLQEFSDQAAIAGAEQLSPAAVAAGGSQLTSAQVAARRQAFVVLRDNIFGPNGSTSVPTSGLGSCWQPGGSLFDGDIKNCTLPSPNGNYTISICTPAETTATPCTAPYEGGNIDPRSTLSVRITEAVATSLERVLGNSTSNAGAFASAWFSNPIVAGGNSNSGVRLPYALYSNGCITSGNALEVIGGNVYVNQCGLNPQSSGQAGICVERAGTSAGNIDFGPAAVAPSTLPLVNQTVATCEAGSGGKIIATGAFNQLTVPVRVPPYVPPPGYQNFDPTSSGYPAATANNACVNGSLNSAGAAPSNCFNPGYYRSVTGIANNLNPGIYYVTGDPGCTASSATTTCTGVDFSSDTMNANFADVRDMCWAAPNVPASATFVAPCPDGFTKNPTSGPHDPQCNGTPALPVPPPTLVTTIAGIGAGSLGGAAPGNTWWVRVSSKNGTTESATTSPSAVLVNSTLAQQRITVTFTGNLTATGYNVYLSPQAEPASASSPRDEILAATVAAGAGLKSVTLTAPPSAGATAYPVFDTTSCSTGFRNIPARNDHSQNNGVTFVLANKAQLTVSGGQQVYLSPYCSVQRPGMPVNTTTGDAQVALPTGVSYGTDCEPPYTQSGAYLNDGAFVIYGTTTGQISTTTPGTFLGMTGTVFAPQADLSATNQAPFSIVPGQAVVRTVEIQSGNHPNPSFYYPCCGGSGQFGGFTGARQSPTVQLIR